MRIWRQPPFALVLASALFSAYSFSQSAPPSANTFTQEMHSSTVYGTGAPIASLDLQSGPNTGNVYIQFNLANLPAEASVQKATLQLYVSQVLGAGSFDVYQLNSEWSQAALTYANAPTLGVSATGNQPVAIPATADQFILIDVTPLVQGWVNGTIPNNGLALSMTTSAGGALFDSKEAINTSHMPELQIVLNGPAGPQGPIGPTGPPGATGVTSSPGTGSTGFNFRNAFVATTTYFPYDVVTYNGSTYDAIAAIAPGEATPDTNTKWALMAQQGATGAMGPQGPAGPAGPPGATIATGSQGSTNSQSTGGTGFNFRNAFDATATYSPYDVVTYNGSTYDALAAVAPGAPTPDVNPSWTVMAQQGAKGAAGVAGPNNLSAATTSAIAGIIKGSGGALAAAIAGTDYVVPSGSITGNAATATQLSSTGSNGSFWGISGGVQGFYQPALLPGTVQQAAPEGGNCQAVTAANGAATVNWATSSCAVITAGGSNVSSITLSNPTNARHDETGIDA
jgi:hypothetical protein